MCARPFASQRMVECRTFTRRTSLPNIRLVKEKTGRKMQAKAEPLREGVVVIKEDTTMEELQELGKRFQERFGVTPVQIAIHKDEGHWQGKYGNRTSMPI